MFMAVRWYRRCWLKLKRGLDETLRLDDRRRGHPRQPPMASLHDHLPAEAPLCKEYTTMQGSMQGFGLS